MKYLLIIGDGMADRPVPQLDGRTPLEVAHIPTIDWLAARSTVGTVINCPPPLPAGSETAILSIFGCDPLRYFTGRSPMEAAAAGIPLSAGDAAFRCNLVALSDGEIPFPQKKILSHSAGSIEGEDALAIVDVLKNDARFSSLMKELSMEIHPFPAFRQITVIHHCDTNGLSTFPPHDHLGECAQKYVPCGNVCGENLHRLMVLANQILEHHPINEKRRQEGKLPANGIWFWAEGTAPSLPGFYQQYGHNGAVISAVPLCHGIGVLRGLEMVEVDGATGELDTNFAGKLEATWQKLQEYDFVALHLEAPDECTHNGDLPGKIQAIEWLDSKLVAPLLERLQENQMPHRILLLSDHETLTETRGHAPRPVPYLLYDSTAPVSGGTVFTEAAASCGELLPHGHDLLDLLFQNRRHNVLTRKGEAMSKLERLGIRPADILLPKDCDMSRWAVVACDQFTSQPEYWEEVERIVGDAPSALRLILPEGKLNHADVEKDIANINRSMQEYLARNLFRIYGNSIFYVERTQSNGDTRHGLVAAIDLEQYDYTPGSGSLIRATEGTVLERIPPRVQVRKDAPIELPHVILLIDDPDRTCIEPITASTDDMESVYDFDLMMNGGHLKGWRLNESQVEALTNALGNLVSEDAMQNKYQMTAAPLLFAVGDGNHSLATAKTCYENLKKVTPSEQWADLPARYALVEIENLHDDALKFEAIHRIVFGTDPEKLLHSFRSFYPDAYEGKGEGHTIAYTWSGGQGYLTVPNPSVQLAVGTLQNFLDAYLKENGGEVDYIHGDAVINELGAKPGNIGFRLSAIGKNQLFKTVMADGVLPRKTFSMGHAEDKRYYVEGRRIR